MKKITAAVLDGQMTFDTLDAENQPRENNSPEIDTTAVKLPDDILPQPWDHPEYGRYYIRPAETAHGDFEVMYYDMLYKLIKRKWDELFMGGPYPEIRRIELLNDQDLENPGEFAPVQGIMLKMPVNPWNAMFIRPGRLETSLEKNKCLCMKLDDRTYAVSPFMEWEMAEFWESNLYDLN